jgi:hypothetical protein
MFKCLLLTFFISFNTFAMTRAKVTLPDTKKIHGRVLFLNGMGIRKATTLGIKVYIAGLYLEEKNENPESIIEDLSSIKQLVLHFVRDIDQEKVIQVWREGFDKTSGNELKKKINTFLGYMSDVKAGQVIKMNFLPTKVEVMVHNVSKKPIYGKSFNKALLNIWFKGLRDKTLSNDLLGIR